MSILWKGLCCQNPGSCSQSRRVYFMNTLTQAASKRLYYRKAESSQHRCWEQEKELPLFQLLHGGFYFLRTGIPTWDLDIIHFSHWPCPITYIRPYSIRAKTGVLEVAMPYKFYGYFVLLSPRLGVSTLYIFLLTITCIGQGLMSTFT